MRSVCQKEQTLKKKKKKNAHIVGSLHPLEISPVLLCHLLPPLVELVGVHLEGLIPVGSLDFRRGRPLVHVQQRVQLISGCELSEKRLS